LVEVVVSQFVFDLKGFADYVFMLDKCGLMIHCCCQSVIIEDGALALWSIHWNISIAALFDIQNQRSIRLFKSSVSVSNLNNLSIRDFFALITQRLLHRSVSTRCVNQLHLAPSTWFLVLIQEPDVSGNTG